MGDLILRLDSWKLDHRRLDSGRLDSGRSDSGGFHCGKQTILVCVSGPKGRGP